jgi:hypothetical protein
MYTETMRALGSGIFRAENALAGKSRALPTCNKLYASILTPIRRRRQRAATTVSAVVGHHDGGSAVLGQHGHDVLQEVELLVRGRDEEILAVVILPLGVDLASSRTIR